MYFSQYVKDCHFVSHVFLMEFLSYLTNRDNPTHILIWFNKKTTYKSCMAWYLFFHPFSWNWMTSLTTVLSSSSLPSKSIWTRNSSSSMRVGKKISSYSVVLNLRMLQPSPELPKISWINCYPNVSTLRKKTA